VTANYREASRARSVDEFVSKIERCVQEADETQLWLELLRDDCALEHEELTPLWKETDELLAIFVTMSKNAKQNKTKFKT
jgi:four helix bundle protein